MMSCDERRNSLVFVRVPEAVLIEFKLVGLVCV